MLLLFLCAVMAVKLSIRPRVFPRWANNRRSSSSLNPFPVDNPELNNMLDIACCINQLFCLTPVPA